MTTAQRAANIRSYLRNILKKKKTQNEKRQKQVQWRKFSFKECSWGRQTHLCFTVWRSDFEGRCPLSSRKFVILSTLRNKSISLYITGLPQRFMSYLLSNDLIQQKHTKWAKFFACLGIRPTYSPLPRSSSRPEDPPHISSKHGISLDNT